MLAYVFPPLAGGGVQRPLKFVRYLEPLGWDVTVISTRSRVYPARDPSLLREVPPGTRVIRTTAFPLGRWVGLVLHRLGLRRAFAWATWPDGGLGWAPFALLAGFRAALRERPDVLYSTSPPQAAHLAAFVLQFVTGIPWVADFRDEWAADAHRAHQPKALAALSERVERAIARRAQKVVVAGSYFRLAGLSQNGNRRIEIMNGVDEADFTASSQPERDRFVLTYVGTIYGIRDPTPALRALADLVTSGVIDGARLEVRFVGSLWVEGFEFPPELRVEAIGYVEHERAVGEMLRATALLLYVPGSSLAPSGKLFEYLASGRPVLCLANPDNLATRLVREWKAGVVADPHDEQAIKEAILTLWQRWEADGLPNQDEVRRLVLRNYSRRATAGQLAEIFEEVRRA